MKKSPKLAVVPKPSTNSRNSSDKKIGLNFNTLNSITDRAFFLALQMIDAYERPRQAGGFAQAGPGGGEIEPYDRASGLYAGPVT